MEKQLVVLPTCYRPLTHPSSPLLVFQGGAQVARYFPDLCPDPVAAQGPGSSLCTSAWVSDSGPGHQPWVFSHLLL